MALPYLAAAFALTVPAGAFTPLGSKVPERCVVGPTRRAYDCPSRMICDLSKGADDLGGLAEVGDGFLGKCVCDKFFGFVGPSCLKPSRTTWALGCFLVVAMAQGIYCLVMNVDLARALRRSGRLQPNAIGRTVAFNGLATLPTLALNGGFMLIITGVDEDMAFQEFAREPTIAALFILFILSTLSVSIVWMEMVEKTVEPFKHCASLMIRRISHLGRNRPSQPGAQ